MRNLLILLLLLFSKSSLFAQSAKSDSLFSTGVSLYNLGKYEEAISLFSECDRIDKEEMDSVSNRRDYAAMWLAACFRKLGNIEQADIIYPYYNDHPVDRRLTVQSDSLDQLARNTDDEKQKLNYLRQCANLEAINLGRSHYFRANTLQFIAFLELTSKSFKELKETMKELEFVANNCSYWRANKDFIWAMNREFSFSNFNKDIDDEDYILLQNHLIGISFPSINDPYGTDYDGVWHKLVISKISFYEIKDKQDIAYETLESAHKVLTKFNVNNSNSYDTYSLFAKYLYKRFVESNDDAEKRRLDSFRHTLYEKMLQIAATNNGKKSFEYGSTLFKLANMYAGSGLTIDKNKGKEFLHQAFDILLIPEICLDNFNEVSDYVRSAKLSFENVGDSESYVKYINLLTSILPKESNVLGILKERAKNFRNEGNYEEAINTYNKMLVLYEQDGDVIKNMEIYKDLAFCHYLQHDYSTAIIEYQKYDSLFCTTKNENIKDLYFYASTLGDLADCYLNIGDTLQFTKVYDRYSIITEKCLDSVIQNDSILPDTKDMRDRIKIEMFSTYGKECFDKEQSLMRNNKNYYVISQKAKKYIKLAEQLNIESSLPDEDKEDNSVMHNYLLGQLYTYEQKFDSAYYHINTIIENGDFNKFGRHLTAYSQMAQLYSMVSIEPEISLRYRLKSVSILSNIIVNHYNEIMQQAIDALFELFVREWKECSEQSDYLGDYEGKFTCYDNLLSVIGKIEGLDSQLYIKTKIESLEEKAGYYSWIEKDNNLSRIMCDSIRYFFENNRDLLREDANISYTSIGRNYLYYYNDTVKAEYYLQKHEDEIKDLYPNNYKQNKDYIEIQKFRAEHMNGGDNHIELKDVAALYRQVPEYKDEYLNVLYTMASHTKDSIERITLLEEILAFTPEWKGWPDSKHFKETDLLTNLIEAYLHAKTYDKVLPLYDITIERLRTSLFERFASATEDDRQFFWEYQSKNVFSLAEPLKNLFPENVSSSIIYDNLLMRKNLLLNTSISAINFIRSEGDSLLIAKYNRSTDLKEALHTTSGDSIFNDGRIISRHQAEALVERFDKEIMERAAIIGNYTKGLNIRWKNVQEKIDKNSIAIEFSKYESFEGRKYYAATILKHEGEPVFVPLFEETELARYKNNSYTTSDLSDMIWKPLEMYIKDIKNIYFSPDGQLYNIAIESIPYWGDCNILMSEKWNLFRLSSTKEIAMLREHNEKKTATIYGGIKYDIGTDVLLANSKKYGFHHRSFEIQETSLGDSLGLRAGVNYLPATMIEAEEIDNTIINIMDETLLLTDTLGTEASFKDLSGKNTSLMHIATHGFYWTEQEAKYRTDLNFLSLNISHSRTSEDKALTRSGLLFAGANNALSGKEIPHNIDDGILTAKEISQLDLRGLDLVVLSACQTGLGEISGDGVFGLQRGFKKAGAGSIIMSLWKVDDNATQLLMTQFYKNLVNGKSKYDALREAQNYIRNKVNNDPKYWAAFILLDAIN